MRGNQQFTSDGNITGLYEDRTILSLALGTLRTQTGTSTIRTQATATRQILGEDNTTINLIPMGRMN